MKTSFAQLKETVISKGLCARCGVCAGVCPAAALSFDEANFPVLTGRCTACGLCCTCCPGAEVNLPALAQGLFGRDYAYDNLHGHTENLYVVHAADSAVRHAGASGGVVTGLLLHLLETGRIAGAVVVGFDPDRPCRTKSVLATMPEEIRSCAQSKYCVTPSMSLLREIRRQEGKFAVVALPCQIHGLRKLAQADPELAAKIEVIFGLYCNCTMNPDGPLEALQAVGIREEEVARFQFRGGPWPGGLTVQKKDGRTVHLHPGEAIRLVVNVLFRLFGAKRCRLCLDGFAEFADLSFGDFWAFDYPGEFSRLERCTLVSQRTAKGMQILKEAEQTGAVVLHPLPVDRVSKRILAMVKEKRNKAAVYLSRRQKKGLPNPNYHISIPEPDLKAWKQSLSFLLFDRLRGGRMQTVILKLLFSPLIVPLHTLNRARIKLFARYHNN